MKADIDVCKRLAESIAVELYESCLCDDLEGVESFAATRITDMLMHHDRELLNHAHMAYVEAVKKEGER